MSSKALDILQSIAALDEAKDVPVISHFFTTCRRGKAVNATKGTNPAPCPLCEMNALVGMVHDMAVEEWEDRYGENPQEMDL